MTHTNAVTWFEMPTADLDRAVTFYETVLNAKLVKFADDPEDRMYIFPAEPEGVKGALVKRTFQKPGDGGALVYLDVTGDLDGAIARVPQAGGTMLIPRTTITGGHGSFACFRDSEGNCVGLHTSK